MKIKKLRFGKRRKLIGLALAVIAIALPVVFLYVQTQQRNHQATADFLFPPPRCDSTGWTHENGDAARTSSSDGCIKGTLTKLWTSDLGTQGESIQSRIVGDTDQVFGMGYPGFPCPNGRGGSTDMLGVSTVTGKKTWAYCNGADYNAGHNPTLVDPTVLGIGTGKILYDIDDCFCMFPADGKSATWNPGGITGFDTWGQSATNGKQIFHVNEFQVDSSPPYVVATTITGGTVWSHQFFEAARNVSPNNQVRFALDQDNLYLATNFSGVPASSGIRAYNETTGAQLWFQHIFPASDVSTQNGKVFLWEHLTLGGEAIGKVHLVARDTKTGNIVWQSMPETFVGYISSSVLARDLVIDRDGVSGGIVARHQGDGTIAWKSAVLIPPSFDAHAMAAALGSNTLVVAPYDNNIYILDLATGTTLSKQNIGFGGGDPVIIGNRLYVKFGGIVAFQAFTGNQKPSVSITNPTANQVVSASADIKLTVNVSDPDSNISTVEYFDGAVKVGENKATPFDFNWPVQPGKHTFTAKVTDSAGESTTSAAVAFTANQPPSLRISSPNTTTFEEGSPLSVKVSANDADGTVASVDLYQNDVKVDSLTAAPYNFILNGLSTGKTLIKAVATDNTGASSTSDVMVLAITPTKQPGVSITTLDSLAKETGNDPGSFQIKRVGSTASDLVVHYTVGGSARNGTDYQNLPGAITIPAGSDTSILTVQPRGVKLAAGDADVIVKLTTDASYTVASPDGARLILADPDSMYDHSMLDWSFNEGTGSTTSDLTGKGHTGTQTAGFWESGLSSTSLAFNGTSTQVTTANEADFSTVKSAFSEGFWVNPSSNIDLPKESRSTNIVAGSYGQHYAITPKLYSGTSTDAGMGVSVGKNGVVIVELADNYNPALISYPATITSWTRIDVVVIGSVPTLYINGKLAEASLFLPPRGLHPSASLSLGGGKDMFQGALDDVTIFDKSLSTDEVQNLYRTFNYDLNQSAPVIAVPPINQTVAAGQKASFSVVIKDTTPVRYQWQLNDTDILGAVQANYTIPLAQASQNGEHYRVVLTNSAGSTISSEVTLSVTANQPPVIVSGPTPDENPTTQTSLTMRALASDDAGEDILTYSWRSTATNGSTINFTNSDSNQAKTTVAQFSGADTYMITVTAKDNLGLTSEKSVSVTVQQTIESITLTPSGAAIKAGTTKQFTAVPKDKFGHPVTPVPQLTWSTTAGIGTISQTGLLTLPASGFTKYNGTVIVKYNEIGAGVAFTVDAPHPTIQSVSVNPANTSTGQTTLTVTATDPGGEADLIYTWTEVPGPSGILVSSYSVNGTNVAKTTIVFFKKTGSTNFSIDVRNKQNNAAVSTAHVFVSSLGTGGTDITPPSIFITTPKDKDTVKDNVTVSGTFSDDKGSVPGLKLFIDAATTGTDITNRDTTKGTYSIVIDSTLLTNLEHTLKVVGTDPSGNKGSASIVVRVNNLVADTTPPTIAITKPTANQSVSGDMQLVATASDNTGVAKIDLLFDGSFYKTVSAASINETYKTTSLTNGSHTFKAIAYDAAGNTASASVDFIVNNDVTPPVIAITNPTENDTISGIIKVSGTTTDAGTGVKTISLLLDNKAFQTPTGSSFSYDLDTTTIADGAHTLQLSATDVAGNTTTLTRNFTVKQPDKTPPQVVISSPTTNQGLSGSIVVKATAIDNVAVTKTELYINNLLVTTITNGTLNYTFDTTSVADGTVTFLVKAYDAASNTSSAMVSANVINTRPDTTPPTVTITTPVNNAQVADSIIVTGSATDDSGSINKTTLAIDGTAIATANTPFSFGVNTTLLSNGNHVLRVTAVDASSNAGFAEVTINVQNVIPDTTPPKVTITAPKSTDTLFGTFNIVGVATANPTSSISKTEISLDNIIIATSAATFNVAVDSTKLSNADHTIAVIATDAANRTAKTTLVIHVYNDTTPPTIMVTSPLDNQKVSGQIAVSGSVTDDIGLQKLTINLDGQLFNETTQTPFSFTLDTTKQTEAVHQLSFIATDPTGNKTTLNRSITIEQPDLTPPAVVVTGPSDNSSASGNLTYTATASDNKVLSKFELYLDNTLVATAPAASLSGAIDTTKLTNDKHVLEFRATDGSNNKTTVQRSVTIFNDLQAPVVKITAPVKDAKLSGSVTVTVNATDNDKVSELALLVDTTPVAKVAPSGTTISFSLNTTQFATGVHTIKALVKDPSGNTATDSVSVTIDNTPAPDTTPPQVRISAPQDKITVTGSIDVVGVAIDNTSVSKVGLWVDGALKTTTTQASFSIALDTTSLTNGDHILEIRANDPAGNIGKQSISVKVDNGSGSLPKPDVSKKVRLKLYVRDNGDHTLKKVKIEFRDSVSGAVISSVAKSTGSDGLLLITDSNVVDQLDPQKVYDIRVKADGFLGKVKKGVANILTQEIDFTPQEKLKVADFDGDNTAKLNDFILLVKGYNDVHDASTQVVFDAYDGAKPTLADIIRWIAVYNTFKVGE